MTRSRLAIPLLVSLLWWTALPARAGISANSAKCPEGSACVWDESNFQGNRGEISSGGCIDSRIRSAVNRTDRVVHLFFNGGCVGAQAGTLQPGDEAARISAGSATGNCDDDVAGSCSGETPAPEPPAPS